MYAMNLNSQIEEPSISTEFVLHLGCFFFYICHKGFTWNDHIIHVYQVKYPRSGLFMRNYHSLPFFSVNVRLKLCGWTESVFGMVKEQST